MQAITSPIKQKSAIPLKSIALPIEHGSWGFVFEPIAAGLLLGPSLPALFITILVTGGFLARQPLKFVLADWQQGPIAENRDRQTLRYHFRRDRGIWLGRKPCYISRSQLYSFCRCCSVGRLFDFAGCSTADEKSPSGGSRGH